MPSDTYTLTISDLGVAAVADNAVTTAKILDANVTTAKIADANVTAAKLATDSVITAKIVDLNVTTAKIAAGAVTDVKLATNAVTTIKITDLNVTTDKLAAAAVTNDKLAVITGSGKIANSATTATDANTASAIVARDGIGNFSAGTITAALTGNATTATNLAVGTAGALPYQTAAGATAFISAVATGNVLLSGGAATVPQYGKVNLTTHIAGTLPVGNGGTGVTAASTGTGGVVLSSGPTLVAPVLGTPAAGSVLTNCTGLPLTSGAGVTGTLPVAYGGTGVAASAYGQTGSQTAGTSTGYTTTYAKLELTTSLDAAAQFDANSVNNRLRYTGSATRKFLVFASMDMLSSTNGAQFSIKIAKNDTVIDATQCNASVSIKSAGTGIAKLVSNWIIEFAQNNYVEIFVASVGSGETGIPQRMRLVATPVF